MTCLHYASFNGQVQCPQRTITLIRDFTKAWAQATREDNPIIVIQSEKHKFIGIRHRTLCLGSYRAAHLQSSYGKLHLGIYTTAVRDAIDRASQRVLRGHTRGEEFNKEGKNCSSGNAMPRVEH